VPGGGFQDITEPSEGSDTAIRLQAMGYSAFVLHYRVPADTPLSGPDATWAPPIDVQRAMRLVRANADRWPGRVNVSALGIMGFSAGAAIAQTVNAKHASRLYEPTDAADDFGARPDFVVLMYPGGTNTTRFRATSHDSALNSQGQLTLPVASEQPPTYIAVSRDDNVTGVEGAVALHHAIEREEGNRHPEPYHTINIYEGRVAGHAFGVCDSAGRSHGTACDLPGGCESEVCKWPVQLGKWLQTVGFAPAAEAHGGDAEVVHTATAATPKRPRANATVTAGHSAGHTASAGGSNDE